MLKKIPFSHYDGERMSFRFKRNVYGHIIIRVGIGDLKDVGCLIDTGNGFGLSIHESVFKKTGIKIDDSQKEIMKYYRRAKGITESFILRLPDIDNSSIEFGINGSIVVSDIREAISIGKIDCILGMYVLKNFNIFVNNAENVISFEKEYNDPRLSFNEVPFTVEPEYNTMFIQCSFPDFSDNFHPCLFDTGAEMGIISKKFTEKPNADKVKRTGIPSSVVIGGLRAACYEVQEAQVNTKSKNGIIVSNQTMRYIDYAVKGREDNITVSDRMFRNFNYRIDFEQKVIKLYKK